MTRLDQFIPTLVFLLLRFVQTYGQYSGRVDVSTTRGPLFGLHFDQGNDTTQLFYGQADVFFGIPFAVPPTDVLRFAVKLRFERIRINTLVEAPVDHEISRS